MFSQQDFSDYFSHFSRLSPSPSPVTILSAAADSEPLLDSAHLQAEIDMHSACLSVYFQEIFAGRHTEFPQVSEQGCLDLSVCREICLSTTENLTGALQEDLPNFIFELQKALIQAQVRLKHSLISESQKFTAEILTILAALKGAFPDSPVLIESHSYIALLDMFSRFLVEQARKGASLTLISADVATTLIRPYPVKSSNKKTYKAFLFALSNFASPELIDSIFPARKSLQLKNAEAIIPYLFKTDSVSKFITRLHRDSLSGKRIPGETELITLIKHSEEPIKSIRDFNLLPFLKERPTLFSSLIEHLYKQDFFSKHEFISELQQLLREEDSNQQLLCWLRPQITSPLFSTRLALILYSEFFLASPFHGSFETFYPFFIENSFSDMSESLAKKVDSCTKAFSLDHLLEKIAPKLIVRPGSNIADFLLQRFFQLSQSSLYNQGAPSLEERALFKFFKEHLEYLPESVIQPGLNSFLSALKDSIHKERICSSIDSLLHLFSTLELRSSRSSSPEQSSRPRGETQNEDKLCLQ